MANQNGRPIAPARKLVALVLGTLAVFVAVFGVGLTSWAIVVLGLAMLALSIALGLVNVVRRGARAWVSGTAQVKAVSDPPVSSAYGRAELQIVVVAPGLPVTEVLVRDPRVPVDKWPRPGETLPITVDVDDMRRVRIDWVNAPDRADPPPPGRSYDDATFTEPADEYDDDLLGEPEPPPWATRDQNWGLGPDEPPPPPPPAATATEPADPDDLRGSPVVVHDTPAGPVVEGQWVGHDEPNPLPKRAPRAGPIPSPSPPSEPDSPPSSRPAGARPSPRPSPRPRAAAATATVEPDAAPSGSFAFSGTGNESPDAPPRPADHPATPGQWSRTEPRADDAPPAAAPVDLDLDEPDAAAPAREEPPVRENAPAREEAAVREDAPVREGAPARENAPAADEARSDVDGSLDGPGVAAAPRPRNSADDEPAGTTATTPRPRRAGDDQVMTSAAEAPVADDPHGPSQVDDPPRADPAPADGARADGPARGDGTARGDAHDPEIDLALEGDPEPAPETTPAARAAVEHDLIGPPPHEADVAPPESPAPASPTPEGAAPESPTPEGAAPESPAAAGIAPDVAEPAADRDEPGQAGSAPPPPPPTPVPDDPPVISGLDTPSDPRPDPPAVNPTAAAAGATAAGAAAGAGAVPLANGHSFERRDFKRAKDAKGTKPAKGTDGPDDPPRGPWADLEGGYQPEDRTDEVITAYPSARPGPAGAIHGVGITVLVTNLERSISFYRDMLGFFEIDSGQGSAVLASGDTRLVLRTVHDLSMEAGRLIYLNLEVGDVEAVYQELKSKGVTFVHAPRAVNRGDKLELWSATFTDPDKHNIAVSQWRAIN